MQSVRSVRRLVRSRLRRLRVIIGLALLFQAAQMAGPAQAPSPELADAAIITST